MTPEEKLHIYLNATSAYGSKAIPGKNTFTFISKETGLPQVWKLNAQSEPILFRSFDDRVMGVHHAPQGDKTIVGVDYKGNEKQQLHMIKEGEEASIPLAISKEHFHNFGGFSPKGDKIAFSSNRRNPGYFDIFVQDLTTRKIQKVYDYDGICDVLQWLPDGRHLLLSVQINNLDNRLYILNIASGEFTTFGNRNKEASYSSVIFKKDEKNGYLLADLDAETHYIARFSMDNPYIMEPVFQVEDWDVEEMQLSPDEQTLLFTVNEGGYSRLLTMDTATHAEKTIEGLPAGVISSLSWLDDTYCIFTLKTPIEPGDIWQVNLSNLKVDRLTNFGQSLAAVPLYEPESCHYKSFDGLVVPYFYYSNHNTTSDKPAVVNVHGGPEGQTKAEYNPVIQYLVDQGFAVAAPNVRGSSGYGRSYIYLDDVRKRMDSVEDLAWLIRDLTSKHSVSKDKIGIMGRSYGGFMVLAAMTHYPNLWAAGVDIVGISHFKTFLENTGAWRRKLRENEYGSLEHDIDFFEEIAPLNHTEKISAPLLVFHGRNDTRVPVGEAEQLVSDMKKRDQKVELTIFENEGHQTEKIANHMTMHTDTANFFSKHLQSY